MDITANDYLGIGRLPQLMFNRHLSLGKVMDLRHDFDAQPAKGILLSIVAAAGTSCNSHVNFDCDTPHTENALRMTTPSLNKVNASSLC